MNDAHIAVLGIGAVALVLQLFVIARCRRTTHRAAAAATASLAILLCAALLATGHQPPRMRAARHEAFDSALLRDRPAAVSYETPHILMNIE